MLHDHGDAASPQDEAGFGRNRRPLVIALLITATYLVAEVAGAFITGSLALLADAGHMLSDAAALALALAAFWIASRPATPQRTYGYHRVEILAAMANAVTLLLIALYIFWEAYQRLAEPPPVQSLPMLVVAVGGLVANGASAFVLSRGAGENLNLRAAFLHVIGDILGSVGAIVGGLVMLFTGWFYADPIVSVVIGLLVLYSAWRLLRETIDVFLEATPPGVDILELQRTLTDLPGVTGVHDLHVWTVTSGFLAMSGHLTIANGKYEEIQLAAVNLLRDHFGISHVTLQIETAAQEARLHHACYFGPGMTGCMVPPTRRSSDEHRHQH